MKNYTITVNGTAYDVTVEENGAGASAPVAAAPAPKAAAPKKAAAPAAAGGAPINAPMRGTIVDVKVKVGDKVSNGTVVAVLEAMKMENDIVSDKDGVVAAVLVNKGDSVETGAPVVTLN
ncbi:MAG: acetyl-CoA carboxylase biotin carboxyl carrier protein subunit [Oscillospiraceae bacterium]|nr:acetyl-CoA carboxylase biotin carboxyl carrier protein subunit [Oscillospiraceae bacterium]